MTEIKVINQLIFEDYTLDVKKTDETLKPHLNQFCTFCYEEPGVWMQWKGYKMGTTIGKNCIKRALEHLED